MPRIGPISRADLIRYLRKLGFEGPYTGPDHAFMLRGNHKQRIPNKHEGDISKGLLVRILRQAGISVEEWEKL